MPIKYICVDSFCVKIISYIFQSIYLICKKNSNMSQITGNERLAWTNTTMSLIYIMSWMYVVIKIEK